VIRSLTLLAIAGLSTFAATLQYSSETAFQTALNNQVTVIDFASIGGGGSDVLMNNYTEAGVTFTGQGGYLYGRDVGGGWIYGPFNQNVQIALPPGTLAIGMNLRRFYDTTHDYWIELSNGDTFTLSGVNQFAGFITSSPITYANIRILSGPGQGIYNLTSDYVRLLDVSVSQVPEPDTCATGLLGLAILLAARRRLGSG
jgi:hypothetical protein